MAHGHGHPDGPEFAAWADHLELEGETFLPFVSQAAAMVTSARGPDEPPVRAILDIGCGPGVGTCELARRFPDATVTAVDSSAPMLERVMERARSHGLDHRVRTHVAELPDGLDDLGPVDLIWASMSLHHVGDEVAALGALRERLVPGGVLAIAERGDPIRVLPDELDVGRAGLAGRLDEAEAMWFAEMRAGLPGSRPSVGLVPMVETAGFAVVASELATVRLDPPVSPGGRRIALGHLHRATGQLAARFDADDLEAFATLTDTDDPRSVLHRPDLVVIASRRIVIARPRPLGDSMHQISVRTGDDSRGTLSSQE